MMSPRDREALLVVDVQRDFCPGGALPVPGGHLILPAINAHLAEARDLALTVYASRDWHPAITTHFEAYGGEWPPHCVQGSSGAAFHPDLLLPADAIVISKGDDPSRPGYSAFEGHTPEGQPLLNSLRDRHIVRLYVCGLAAEYCVKQTTMDGLRFGLEVALLTDAIAGIDARPGEADRAMSDMKRAGAEWAAALATAISRERR